MASDPSNPARDSASPHDSRSPSPSGRDVLTLRALVSTKDADVIIGKDGENVADLHEQTGVKADIGEVTQGVRECILSLSGSVESVAQACALIISQLCTLRCMEMEANKQRKKNIYNKKKIAQRLAQGTPSRTVSTSYAAHTSMRLLIPHKLIGTIMDRGGLKRKAIQDGSGAQLVVSKAILPQSSEGVLDVQGSPEAIGRAIEEIGRCLLEDWEQGIGTVLYNPGAADKRFNGRRTRTSGGANARVAGPSTAGNPTINIHTQNIFIPSNLVSCIVGRGGSKLTEIRRLSGSKITIAKKPFGETKERLFTIVGTPEANEKALSLMHNQLESEKDRRVGNASEQQNQEEEYWD